MQKDELKALGQFAAPAEHTEVPAKKTKEIVHMFSPPAERTHFSEAPIFKQWLTHRD